MQNHTKKAVMNPELSKLLGAYIADELYPRIQDLPMRVEKKTARLFNFDRKAKLDILFGPDIESLLWDGDNIINCERTPEKADPIAKEVRNQCGDILFNDCDYYYDYVKIEFRLAPRDPQGITDSFRHVKAVFGEQAKKCGFRDDFAITQHWHMSANQTKKGLFGKEKNTPLFTKEFRSPLIISAISSFYTVQQQAPAFFVPPFRIEDGKRKCGSYVRKEDLFTIRGVGSSYNSIYLKRIPSSEGSQTIEPRLGVNDAEQSVALYLSAFDWGMRTHSPSELKQRVNKQPTKPIILDNKMDKNFPDFDGDRFPFGKYGFLTLLEQTINNETIHEMLPTRIFNALVVDAAQRYNDFLKTEPAHDLYDQDERQALKERCEQISFDHS